MENLKAEKQEPILISKKLIDDKISKGYQNIFETNQAEALTYHQLKLINFIELELTDLKDTMSHLSTSNITNNQIKQNLSRAYNTFHELKKLYTDLGMEFLYEINKKMVENFGIILTYLLNKTDHYDKSLNQTNRNSAGSDQSNKQKQQFGQITLDKKNQHQSKRNKNFKRLQGVYLYQQGYSRHIDYDIEAFKAYKQQQKVKQITEEEVARLKKQQKIEFDKQIANQLNDHSYLTVDGEDITQFLNRQKNTNIEIKSQSIEEQLVKIAKYFKESEHEALEFLRESKNIDFFHQITQGFHSIVEDYTTAKNKQTALIYEKFNQVLEILKRRILFLEQVAIDKAKETSMIKQEMKKKKIYRNNIEVQTMHNFDEQIRKLYSRIVQQEMIIEEMKQYIKKSLQEQNRQKERLINTLNSKDSYLKEYQQKMNDKTNYSLRLERKIKLIQEGNKNRNVVDPIQFFNNLDPEMQRALIDQLKQKGFIFNQKYLDVASKGKTKATIMQKSPVSTPNSILQQGILQMGDKLVRQNERQKKNRGSYDLRNKKESALEGKQEQQDEEQQAPLNLSSPKTQLLNTIQREKKLYFVDEIRFKKSQSINQNSKPKLGQGNSQPKNEKAQQNKTSKRVIRVKVDDEEAPKGKRVFDVTDRSNFSYSQTYIDIETLKSSKKILGSKTDLIESQTDFIKQNQVTDQKEVSKQKEEMKLTENDDGVKCEKPSSTGHFQKSSIHEEYQYKQKDSHSQKPFDQPLVNKQQSLPMFRSKEKQTSIKLKSKQNHINSSSLIQQPLEIDSQVGKYKQKAIKSEKHHEGTQVNFKRKESLFKVSQEASQEQLSNFHHSNRGHHQKKINVEIYPQFNLTIQGQYPKKQYSQPKQVSDSSKSLKKTDTTKLTMGSSFYHTSKQSSDHEAHHNERGEGKQAKTHKNIENEGPMKLSQNQSIKFHTVINQFTKGNKKNRNQGIGSVPNQCKQLSIAKKNKYKNNMKENIRYRSQKNSVYNSPGLLELMKKSEKTNEISEKSHQKFYELPTTPINGLENIDERLLEEEFNGASQIVEAAKQSSNIQEFEKKVYKLHYPKCGATCQHLKRYIDSYQKLKAVNKKDKKRQTIKVHVENMNMRFDGEQSNKQYKLPQLTRK